MLRHLRAAAVLVHVVLITAMALPSPPDRMNKAQLAGAQGQAQLTAWADVARGVGVDVSDQELGQWVWDIGNGWVDRRQALLRPLQPYYKLTGTRQAWRMFSVVSRRPTTLEIYAQRGGEWELVYANGVAGERWRSRQLDQERVRAFLAAHGNLSRKKDYHRFVRRWIAPTLMADDPSVTAVKVQLRRTRSLSASAVREGKVAADTILWEKMVSRDAPE